MRVRILFFMSVIFIPLHSMRRSDERSCKQIYFIFQQKIDALHASMQLFYQSHYDKHLYKDLDKTYDDIMHENSTDFCARFTRIQDVHNHLQLFEEIYHVYVHKLLFNSIPGINTPRYSGKTKMCI